MAADPAAIAVLERAAVPAAVGQAGLAGHSGCPDRFEAATAGLVAGRGRRAVVRAVHPIAVPVERTAPAATVATAGLAVVQLRRAAVRVARPTAGPAVKQVRRDCEKAGRPAAIAAELEPGSATAIAAELEPDFATAIAGSVRAAGLVQVAVPTAEEQRKGSPEPGAAGFVAELAEQYFDHGSSYPAVAAAAGEEAAAPIADEAPAAGWEGEYIPAVPIAAVRVAAAVAVVPTAVALPEVHFEVPGSVPIAAGQAGARGTGQVEAASTAAASLAQAAAEQLVPEWVEQRVPVRLVPG